MASARRARCDLHIGTAHATLGFVLRDLLARGRELLARLRDPLGIAAEFGKRLLALLAAARRHRRQLFEAVGLDAEPADRLPLLRFQAAQLLAKLAELSDQLEEARLGEACLAQAGQHLLVEAVDFSAQTLARSLRSCDGSQIDACFLEISPSRRRTLATFWKKSLRRSSGVNSASGSSSISSTVFSSISFFFSARKISSTCVALPRDCRPRPAGDRRRPPRCAWRFRPRPRG